MKIIPSRFTAVALAVLASSVGGTAQAQEPADAHVVVRPGPVAAPPWLGLGLGAKEARDGKGVEVTAVLRRSPADGSGIVAGDRVIAVAGEPVDLLVEVQRVVRARRAGEKIGVTVSRGGKLRTFQVALSEQPDAETRIRNHLLGYPAPDLTMRFVGDDKEMALSAFRGKPTIVEFWATWCGPCHRVQARLGEVKTKFADRIHIVGVSTEDAPTVRAHLRRFPAYYAMAVDEAEQSREGFIVESIPQIVILDAEHNVVAVLFGVSGADDVEKKLASLLGAP